MRRSRKRVGLDVVIGMAKEIRREEHDQRQRDQEHAEAEAILGRIIGMERQRILRPLHFHAGRIVRSRNLHRHAVGHSSEERRVGEESASTCGCLWWPVHTKKKTTKKLLK